MEPFVKSTDTQEVRSAKALRKAAWAIFIFQLIFILIYMLWARPWDIFLSAVLSVGLPLLIVLCTIGFTGLMLDILLKPVELLNNRVTEIKLIATLIFFCLPAIVILYLGFTSLYIP